MSENSQSESNDFSLNAASNEEDFDLKLEPAHDSPEIDYLADPRQGKREEIAPSRRQRRDETQAAAARLDGRMWGRLAVWHVVLSGMVCGTIFMALVGIRAWYGFFGGPFIFLVLLLFSVATGVVWLAMSSRFLVSLLDYAATGTPLEENLPEWFEMFDWVASIGYTVGSALLAGIPGALAAMLLERAGLPTYWCLPLSLWLLYPLVLSSILVVQGGTVSDLVSRPFAASFLRVVGGWPQFYAESLLLGLSCWLATKGAAHVLPYGFEFLVVAPGWMAAAMIYYLRLGQLLGRLELAEE